MFKLLRKEKSEEIKDLEILVKEGCIESKRCKKIFNDFGEFNRYIEFYNYIYNNETIFDLDKNSAITIKELLDFISKYIIVKIYNNNIDYVIRKYGFKPISIIGRDRIWLDNNGEHYKYRYYKRYKIVKDNYNVNNKTEKDDVKIGDKFGEEINLDNF